jgi:antitoxin (DNA-binding transcriptional repressor) of toxin-antitoxin stability system
VILPILKIMTNLANTVLAIREERTVRQVNMHEAKTHLSELVEAAEAGEVVVIARHGRPVVRLELVTRKGIRLGTLKGMFPSIPKYFDAPLPPDTFESFYKPPVEP